MPFLVPVAQAKQWFPDFEFVGALTPSEQKAAFHVRQNGSDYCLKIIAPNHGLDRLEREVLAMQKLKHVNVVRLIEYAFRAREGEQRHYLVEEFIEGSDLTTLMTPGETWDTPQIANVFAPICDGLAALQEKSIVHRDIKPSNVRIRTTGEPVLIDFGLARHLDLKSLTATNIGAQIGTPRYFSPEQFTGGRRDIDHRTDLYALGVMIYEAATGTHPSLKAEIKTFEQLSEAVCMSDSHVNADAFKALPPKLQLIVKRLLAKQRAARPTSAALVAKLLREL